MFTFVTLWSKYFLLLKLVHLLEGTYTLLVRGVALELLLQFVQEERLLLHQKEFRLEGGLTRHHFVDLFREGRYVIVTQVVISRANIFRRALPRSFREHTSIVVVHKFQAYF